jgi:hypothetical protein
VQHGNTLLEAIEHALTQTGFIFVHPYDDEEIIAGQGRLGLELVDELKGIGLMSCACWRWLAGGRGHGNQRKRHAAHCKNSLTPDSHSDWINLFARCIANASTAPVHAKAA